MKRILLLFILLAKIVDLSAQYRKEPYLLCTSNHETMKVVFQTYQPNVYLVSYGLTTRYEIGSAQISQLKQGKHENVFEYTFKYLKPNSKYYYRISNKNVNNEYVSSFQSGKKTSDGKVYFLVSGNSFSKGRQLDSLESSIDKFISINRKFNSILLHTGNMVRKGHKDKGWDLLFRNQKEKGYKKLPLIATFGEKEKNKQLFRKYLRYSYASKDDCYYALTCGNLRLVVLDQFTSIAEDSEQYSWLEKELASNPTFKKVILIHSISINSIRNKAPFISLFEKYSVKLVFCNKIIEGNSYFQQNSVHYFSSENSLGLKRKPEPRNTFLAVKYEGNNISIERLDTNLEVTESSSIQ